MNDELADLIAWARDHWDEPPTKMHSGGVEPESEIGAPRWDERWRRWMEGVGSYRAAYAVSGSEERSVRCDHGRSENATCLTCGGTGQIVLVRRLYRWPMRAALATTRGRNVPATWPRLDRVVWVLATSGWSVDAVMASLAPTYPMMGSETFALGVVRRALANCRDAYQLTTRWKPVPESEASRVQRVAEQAA